MVAPEYDRSSQTCRIPSNDRGAEPLSRTRKEAGAPAVPALAPGRPRITVPALKRKGMRIMLMHARTMKVAAIAAVTLGTVLGAAAPALASPPACPSGKVCIWQDAGYGNSRGTFSGNNSDWGVDFGSFWNDSVSSAYNNLSPGHQVALFWNAHGSYGESSADNPSFCLNYHDNNAHTQNFTNDTPAHAPGNFNDEASSDVVYTGSSSWCGEISS